ncbi:peptidyl-prolyl cis-trans isomerase FKBP53-like isoform X2 [Cornus florida]|uniref:peptidyl-prolyl cis-trans isomerase FKBP53-like isoform X2 n=1 Tax=Cornus florida TaxID=4283 RepID=UPI00289D1632|nr:peptidyl-prolyl cis-trans isomerase FKBP53-like isoform X2 [Cornus florida]
MAFWGIVLEPDRPYIYLHNGERGRLRISQAILDAGSRSSTERSMVECYVEDREPVYICSLEPKRTVTCPLNLEFDEHKLVSETDSNGSNDYDTEDKHGDGVIDGDLDMFPSSPVPDDGAVTKEIPNDEKPSNENGISKQPKKKHQLSASVKGNSQRQNVVRSGTGVPVLESEDEDGFPISSPRKSNADVLNAEGKETEMEDDKEDEEPKQNKAKDDPCSLKSLKRKVDAVVRNREEARETVQLVDSSLATTEEIVENSIKRKKKNKKKKLEGREEYDTQTEVAASLDVDQALPIGKEHDEKLTTQKSIDVDVDSTPEENPPEKKKKKKTGKSKKQESGVNANMEQTITGENGSTMEIEGNTEAKPFQVRTFPNGLVIEELAMGKPDGIRANLGKKVSVHYIGKLKKNGKIFDSNVGRAPFKFRLGVGEVIKGWDVGVNGMRVGDKRRLTIPPAMGYGARGAGGAIPPNSWLLFDVELVDVR